MNTIENTPAHCHGCAQFTDCPQAKCMSANTEPVEGWVDDCEVYCADCLDLQFPANDDDDGSLMGFRSSNDNDWREWCNTFDGESDSPIHCNGCGVPIIHDLTIEGVEYVREAVADNSSGCCREVWPVVWADILERDDYVDPDDYDNCDGYEDGDDCDGCEGYDGCPANRRKG